jgi:Skp family chaperone for outer membrane proteins
MRHTLFILACLVSVPASAGVYKCTAADGNTVYQSSPCDAGQSKKTINTKTGVSTDLDAEQNKLLSEQNKQQADIDKQKAEEAQLVQKREQLKADTLNEIEKNKQLIKNNPKQFSAYAIPPYIPDALPELVKQYQNRLPDIERLRRQAAEKALASGECGRVEADELNIKTTKDALVILVDCSSGKSFYFTEQELTKY